MLSSTFFHSLFVCLKCPALLPSVPQHVLYYWVFVECLKYENQGGGWASDRHTQRRPVTHTKLSSDSISIPLLAALQSAQLPLRPSFVAAIIFVWRLHHKSILRLKPVDETKPAINPVRPVALL